MRISCRARHSERSTGSGGRRSAAMLAAVLAAISLAACGSSSQSSTNPSSLPSSILDTGIVQKAIEESVLAQRHVHASVTCPSVVPQEQGHDFVCIATVGKKKTPFVVEQTNDGGHVTYHAK
jgi:Domain of unknown function (DUF4333)